MKLVFIILVAMVALATGRNVLPLQYEEGSRFFFFPDGQGKIHLIDAEEKSVETRFSAERDVNLLLFTKQNPNSAQKIIFGNGASIDESNFDKSKPTKFIAHGWTDDADSAINAVVKDAFLAVLDVNVIVFDWGKGASGLYTAAVLNVAETGEFLASVVDWLVDEGLALSNVHLLGHSLGSHVVGTAGRSILHGQVPYITGFDPAMPLWGSSSGRIGPTDGQYVEIIHTNGGYAGLNEPVGHNDFYPNGGTRQPGCGLLDFDCSHARSWELFANSLDNKAFMAIQCNSYKEMDSGKCANLGSLYMGGSEPKPKFGIFYLETSDTKPFYLG